MTQKQVSAQYAQEFKLEAVRQVSAGQAITVMAEVLGIRKASLGNWVHHAAKGVLSDAGADDKAAKVSPEQMENDNSVKRSFFSFVEKVIFKIVVSENF